MITDKLIEIRREIAAIDRMVAEAMEQMDETSLADLEIVEDDDDQPAAPGRQILWQHPTLGITEGIIDQRKRSGAYRPRWSHPRLRDGGLLNIQPAGAEITMLHHVNVQVDVEGAKEIWLHAKVKVIKASEQPGKWWTLNLNGGHGGSGKHPEHDWRTPGCSINLMHPHSGGKTSLRMLVTSRDQKNPFGHNYPGSLQDLAIANFTMEPGREYDIGIGALLGTRQAAALEVDGRRMFTSDNLGALLKRPGEVVRKAHAWVRMMNGGTPSKLIQGHESQDLHRDMRLSVVR